MFRGMLVVLWYESARLYMETASQTTLNRDEMERRRLEAARDLLDGQTQSHVARKFGVSRTTASRWNRVLSCNGVESLRKRRAPGRPTRLNAEQLACMAELFAEGPSAYGFADDRWTTVRLAAAIETRFGVKYDPDHVGRLMHKLGLRTERPARALALGAAIPEYADSRYSPNTDFSQPAISPTVA